MWLGLISSLVGIAGFLFLVYPRISVSPGTSLDLNNPFQTPFILKNDGYLSIFDINYSLGIENVEDVNHNVFSGGMMGGVPKMDTIPQLNPNKTTALFISSTFVALLISSNMRIFTLVLNTALSLFRSHLVKTSDLKRNAKIPENMFG